MRAYHIYGGRTGFGIERVRGTAAEELCVMLCDVVAAAAGASGRRLRLPMGKTPTTGVLEALEKPRRLS